MIRFSCDYGRQLQADDESAGRKVKCPGCAVILRVPEAVASGKKVWQARSRSETDVDGNERHQNEAAVAELRRRLGRANAWRWFFLLLMPVGFFLPCSAGLILGSAHPQAQGFTAPQAFGVAALVLPLVGLGGWLLMAGDRST